MSSTTPINVLISSASYQVAAQLLLALYRFKKRLEVPSTEAGEVISLYYFDENCGAIHQVLVIYVRIVQALVAADDLTLVKS